MSETTFHRYKLKRRTTAGWASNNEVLLAGEPGIEVLADGSEKIKYGDGTKTWAQLGYAAGGGAGGAPSAHKASHATGGTDALSPADIGLSNVDNTSDADKPISTATATALAGKASTGSATTSGLTMATARLLGRTTAGTGAIEEVQVAGGTFANGTLTISGLPSSLTADANGNLTFTGRWIQSGNGAASAPAHALTGTWFTGGTSTTTKPQLLIEPAGTTSTSWSTAGTGLGVNAPSGFTGNLLDLQVGGATRFVVTNGRVGIGTTPYSGTGGAALHVRETGLSTNSWKGRIIAGGDNAAFLMGEYNSQAWLGAHNGGLFAWQTLKINPDGGQELHLGNVISGGGGTAPIVNVRNSDNTVALSEGGNFSFGITTGTRMGTAATQKIAFYGATPIVQPAAVADATDAASVITQLNLALARLRSVGLIAT